jgi:hypothetical protein
MEPHLDQFLCDNEEKWQLVQHIQWILQKGNRGSCSCSSSAYIFETPTQRTPAMQFLKVFFGCRETNIVLYAVSLSKQFDPCPLIDFC